jgi:putative membrane protein (TIGR04086 family)
MSQKGRLSMQSGLLYSPLLLFVILRGLFLAFTLSLVILVICTLLVSYSPMPEFVVPYIVFGGALLSILLCSTYVGKRVDEKGWLRGGIAGFLYVFILVILGLFLPTGSAMSANIITKLFLGFAFGVVGGILGINS